MTSHQVLRDKFGNRIGELQINGSKHILRDKTGNFLGSYDAHDNWTRDKFGNPVAKGDLLVTLLK